MIKTRPKMGAALKAKIALEALRKQATVNELAQRHQMHPDRVHPWRKQPLCGAPSIRISGRMREPHICATSRSRTPRPGD
jgi:transposase